MRLLLLFLWLTMVAGCDDESANGGDHGENNGNTPVCIPQDATSCPEGTMNRYNECLPSEGLIRFEDPVTYLMGGGLQEDAPQTTVELSPFAVDKFEVTNGQYMACVRQCVCTPPAMMTSYSGRYNYTKAAQYDDYPVVSVTWQQAMEYCQGLGMSLPTEAQWEYTAHGGENFAYPWGDTDPDNSKANYGLPMMGDTDPVGTYSDGASPHGAMDMAGNVWEWVHDFYDPDYYGTVQQDPVGPEEGVNRVVRGGSFASSPEELQTKRRSALHPESAFSMVGFRCAMPLEEE